MSSEQTYEQEAGMWKDIAGWCGNFASGVVDAFENGGASAAERLTAIQAKYRVAIAEAITLRDRAIAAADVFAEAVWRDAANKAALAAFDLADESKSAAERLRYFQTTVNQGLANVGRVAGPPSTCSPLQMQSEPVMAMLPAKRSFR
jgi:hypothetical protein